MKISFKGISERLQAYPEWFAPGKSSLIPKPGEFSSENQRPITCLNTGYKWFTSCVLDPMDYHLDYYDLMEMQQRGAKAKCSGTTDNLMIDRMVTLDCHRHKRNLSVAWIDVRKAFDSVDHGWLKKILRINRFPTWICRVVDNLSDSWNTRIAVKTTKGYEVSSPINFNRGLPQGDALCPRLFTLSLNPVAWKLSSTEGYRLSKPVVGNNITHLLYVDDLKVFASSQAKLNRVLKMTEEAMGDIGLLWNPKKCNVLHARRGVIDKTSQGFKAGRTVIDCLKDKQYRFLGAPEQLLQDQKLALETAAKTYLQRLSVIWSSPLSDMNRVTASNQLALPVLTYLMWSQHWNLTDLRNIDREARKVISENGGKHPLGSTALLYLPRHQGGRGLRSVETEYKHTKIKSAIKLYQNKDPTMSLVRASEERAVDKGNQSLIKEASTFAEEMGISLELSHPNPRCLKEDGTEVPNIKNHLKQSSRQQLEDKIRGEKWQGKYLTNRWNDDDLNVQGCFGWLKEWPSAPTHTIAGMMELYEQMLPTRVYTTYKTRTNPSDDTLCRLCGEAVESLEHVLAGCLALAQSKYLARHNAALKVLFFEMLRDLQLCEGVPPWYSPVAPKPLYESPDAQAFWDIPMFAEHNHVRSNRVDVRVIDHKQKRIYAIEMSCPWIDNRKKKEVEKTTKYAPLRWELKQQFPTYTVKQFNIIIDVLGGWSREVDLAMRELFGTRGGDVLLRMQKAVISHSLNIARTFKVLT